MFLWYFTVLWLLSQRGENPGTTVITLGRGRHYLAGVSLSCLHIGMTPHCCVSGKKVALWCAKWFTDRRDINKLFIQDSEAGSPSKPSNARRWKNNRPRSISLPSSYFPSLRRPGGHRRQRHFYKLSRFLSRIFQWHSGGTQLRDKGKVERRKDAASSAALCSLMLKI